MKPKKEAAASASAAASSASSNPKPKKEPSSASSAANTSATIAASIDLEQEQIKEATKRSIQDLVGTGPAKKKLKGDNEKEEEEEEVICLLSDDDDDDDDNSEGTLDLCSVDNDDDDEVMIIDPSTTSAAAATTTSNQNENDNGDGDGDEELMVVGEKNVMRLPHMRQHCTHPSSCTFIVDLRTKHAGAWSHADKKDVTEGMKSNPKMCDLCYCFVCDCLASECKSWGKGNENGERHLFDKEDHCHASDKGVNGSFYSGLRDKVKRGISISNNTNTNTNTNTNNGSNSNYDHMGRYKVANNASLSVPSIRHPAYDSYRSGPFKPDDMGAARSKQCTKCRKCGWWNRFEHRNYTRVMDGQSSNGRNPRDVRRHNLVGDLDWCHACSRVASTRDFGKEQSDPFKPKVGHVLVNIGNGAGAGAGASSRVIGFRIKGRDPRKIDKTKKYWDEFGESTSADNDKATASSNKWKYCEAEMEEDFFKHRIGKNPTIRHILLAIPTVTDDSIPETGYVAGDPYGNDTRPAANEGEALLLGYDGDGDDDDDDNNKRVDGDMRVLRELNAFLEITSVPSPIDLNIQAKWNKATRRGTIEIKLYLNEHAFVTSTGVGGGGMRRQSGRKALFSRLLCAWFNIDRFNLSDLTSGMTVKAMTDKDKKDFIDGANTGLIPNRLTDRQRRDHLKNIEKEDDLNEYNDAAKEYAKSLSFHSSAGARSDRDNCGVVASSDTSFKGTLQRITSSCLVDDVITRKRSYDSDHVGHTSLAKEFGIVSSHRNMRSNRHNRGAFAGNQMKCTFGYTTYLQKKDLGLFHNVDLYRKYDQMADRCSSMNGILQQLENLGHAPAEHVDGLNVELFDFQRQAVGWALERERTEGGLEKFLWAKLPIASSEKLVGGVNKVKAVQLYYSPVLDIFRKDEPADVRGGLIAAQMGLGKTVISLSLVLLNPAPVLPVSGTVVKSYTLPAAVPTPAAKEGSTHKSPSQWPPAPSLPEDAPKRRGRIFSRGTLVVCNVSLVGQWVDEAKSKLKDPGLVYPYHGGSRTRDAAVLANNGVVVTTYAILASDANHHAKKSNDPNYCAPCEQIRWWRIIIDESHSIRDTNTMNYKALKRVTAVNKWAVTGTPMNTTPKDLKGQLSFVGVSHLDKMFSFFSNSMDVVFKTSRNRRRRSWGTQSQNECIGPFLFLMRNIMIRHSISQSGRESKASIMSLPPKEEIAEEIEFSKEERKEYERIEKEAATMYTKLKARGNVNRHYLKLTSALLPLRIACSGGKLDEGQINRKVTPKENLTGNEYQHDFEENEECSICLDSIEEARATICSPVPHIFCKECISGVFSGAQSVPCPCCRTTIRAADMRDVIPKIHNEEEKDEKKKKKDDETVDEKKPKKKKDQTLKDSDILFRSKFERLLKELQRVRDEEPGSKSLVFSQFTSTLQWMKQELPKHGFQFRTLSGNMSMKKRADALREFQSDPPTTIFLLSMRSGAVGINLTQANRVFLMEPALNPALEAQAIGRVYRLGQRKPVQVMKFFMKDSFESRLIKVLKRKFDNVKKPDPSGKNSDEGKKSDESNSKKEDDGNKASLDRSPATATLGHMTKDKADMMTEEFDALFGLTEPEDLPDISRSNSTGSGLKRSNESGNESENENENENYYESDEDSDIYRNGFRRNVCDCGNCSDEDGEQDECVIS